MLYYLKLYLTTLLAFFAVDMVWLGLVARRFYRGHLGSLLAPQTNWPAAIVFYLFFCLGILFFVINPGLQEGRLGATLLRAALFGLVTYATYDLTNLATLDGWPVVIAIVDIMWGICLSTAVGYAGYMAGVWLR